MKMDYSEIAERISRKFSKSGHAVDLKKIESKLRRLVDELVFSRRKPNAV